jgi:alpha-tubulin suppressor-like RCC1 family protein
MPSFSFRLLAAFLFGTAAAFLPAQSPPSAFTQAASPVTDGTATLVGMVVPNGLPTTTWFEWGAIPGLDRRTPPQETGAGGQVVTVKASLAGLEAMPAVRFRLVASNALGVTRSALNQFTAHGLLTGWGANDKGQLNAPAGLGWLVAAACGANHSLALKPDGTVSAWGLNSHGQINVPAGLTNVVALAAGTSQSLALKADGSVAGWGTLPTVWPPATNFVAIAAGFNFNLGLMSNGLVQAWGGVPSAMPAGLSNVVAVAGGYDFVLALKADGRIAAWGSDTYGQRRGATNLTEIIAISAGLYHALALRADGTVIAWGLNGHGQTNVPAGLDRVIAIGAGTSHSLALTEAGTVLAWGAYSGGQTNTPPGLADVVSLASPAGGGHSLALRMPTPDDLRPEIATQDAGPVALDSATLNAMVVPKGLPTMAWFEWGTNGAFNLANPAVEVGEGFTTVRFSEPVTSLPAHTVWQFRACASNSAGSVKGAVRSFVTGGKFAAWGPLGTSQVAPTTTPDFVAVSAGLSNGFALRTDGTVVGWGTNLSGSLNLPAGLSNVVAISTRGTASLGLMGNGQAIAWGTAPAPPASRSNLVAVAIGQSHGVGLTKEGSAVAWASFGDGRTNVPSWLGNVVAVAAGGAHSLALTSWGQVAGWGDNSSGQTNVPLNIGRITAIAAGTSHNLALRDDGTVVAWGGNGHGQTNVPAGLSNVVAIAAGDYHSLAVKADGTVVAWGSNNGGQRDVPAWLTSAVSAAGGTVHSLALRGLTDDDYRPLVFTQPTWTAGANAVTLNGSVALRGLPTTVWFEWGADMGFDQATRTSNVDGSSGLARVSMGISGLLPHSDYVCRIVASNAAGLTHGLPRWFTTGRKVAAWGQDWAGETSPPPGLDDLVAIAAADMHGLGVRAEGTVVAWGKHYPNYSVQPPANLAGVVAVAGGNDHSVALKADGTVTAWGLDVYSWSSVTNVPAGLSNVVAISARDNYCLALKGDGTVAAWGFPTSSETRVPAGLSNVVEIVSGDTHCLALRIDGTVVGWGSTSAARVPAGLDGVASIGAAWVQSYAVKTNGLVVGWADARVPANLVNVATVTSGDHDSLALLKDGNLVAWYHGVPTFTLYPPPSGLSNLVAISSGNTFHLALGPNVPPKAYSLAVTGAMGADLVISLPAKDPNNDPLTRRIATPPVRGTLHQYAASGRGDPILTPDTPVTDSSGRVVFVPEPDAAGIPYETFAFTANDGEYDAPPATVSLSVVPLPSLTVVGGSAGGPFTLNFAGLTNASYRVWASTNLTNWSALGAPNQVQPGVFQFTDAGGLAWRFYRVSCP